MYQTSSLRCRASAICSMHDHRSCLGRNLAAGPPASHPPATTCDEALPTALAVISSVLDLSHRCLWKQPVMGPGSNADLVSRLPPDSRIPERNSNQTTLACKVSQDRRCAHGCWICGEVWGSSFRIIIAVQRVIPVAVGKSQESVTVSIMSGHR
jgi:hypothetical protein